MSQDGTLPNFELTTLDIVVGLAHIAIVLGIGFWVGRGKQQAEGFFLGERASVWPLVGFSLMAANFSGTHFLGLAGAGYHDGIAVWTYEWLGTLILIGLALFILPAYLRSRVSTLPEFLERRYDRRSRYALSGFTVFVAMFLDSAGALYAGAVVAKLLFPGVPLWILIGAVAVIAGTYVVAGGLRAVMITDTIDGILLLIVGAILFYLCYQELGSWQAVAHAAPHGLSLTRPPDDDFLPWPGIVTGALWLGFYFWATNHVVVQKALSARSLEHARWGALFAGLWQLPFLFLLVLPGTMGRVLYPDLAQPDQIWAVLVFDFLPAGVRAFAFAALIAALMSTLDSVLNGAASLVVNDFIKTSRRWRFTDRQLLRIARLTIAALMLFAALWAPQILQFQGLVEYFQAFLAHVTMPVVVVFLGGLFWARASRQAAFYTLVIAAPVGLVAFFANEVLGLIRLQFLYAAGVMLVLSAALFVTLTLLTEAPPRARVAPLMWTGRDWREDTKALQGRPPWQSFRVQGLALGLVTLIMVWIFR